MYPGKAACSSSIGFCRDVERGDVGLCRDLQGWGYTGFALSKNWGGRVPTIWYILAVYWGRHLCHFPCGEP